MQKLAISLIVVAVICFLLALGKVFSPYSTIGAGVLGLLAIIALWQTRDEAEMPLQEKGKDEADTEVEE